MAPPLEPKPPGLFRGLEDFRTGRRPLCTGLVTAPSRSLLPHDDDDDHDEGESEEDEEDEAEEYAMAAAAAAAVEEDEEDESG